MESFTIKLLISDASAQLFEDNALCFFKNFSPEQQILETSMAGCKFRYILPYQGYKLLQGESSCFLTKKSRVVKVLYLEPGRFPSITDIVETMNTPIQERHNHSENCITVKVSRTTQKMRFTLQMKDLVLHF